MASEWQTVCIEDIAERIAMGPFGSSIKVETFVSNGIPIINGQHLHGFKIDDAAGYNFITEEHADRLKKASVRRGDLVFTHRGNVGQVALIPETSTYDRYVVSQSQFYLRCDRNKVIPEYLVAYFKSREGQHKLLANSSSVGVPSIAQPVTYLRSIEIQLPPLSEQRAIAHILGTLDDKIELNRKMNETLEAMARAIFKAWFVDFEPVRAKMEGRWQRGQSLPGLPAHLYDLFPDRLVDSELGEIPEGWEISPFAENVEIIGGGTPKTSVAEYWDGEIPWFSVVDAPFSSDLWVMNTEKKITEEGLKNSSTKVLPIGSTIVSARGTVGRIALVGKPMAMNQSCYALRGKTGTQGTFNYYTTRALIEILKQHVHGSVFDTITRDTLAGVKVVVPPGQLAEIFEANVGPFLQQIRTTLLESQTISSIRDKLLPKLISGNLRVNAIQNN